MGVHTAKIELPKEESNPTIPVWRRTKRSLGQNFLIDRNVARKIVETLRLEPDDTVLEIGPGQGILTELIAGVVHRLIAVEIDRELAEALSRRFGGKQGVEVISADFLQVDLAQFGSETAKLRLMGNIPYHISSPVIFKGLEKAELLADMTLMLQKEVARRVVAWPGTKDYGPLSIHSQLVADTKVLFNVSPTVFRPRPKVVSSLVQWRFHKTPKYKPEHREFFRRFIKAVFSQRRKVLGNSLRQLVDKDALGQADKTLLCRRPEELSVRELVMLSDRVAHLVGSAHDRNAF